jgi:hypothetical protein
MDIMTPLAANPPKAWRDLRQLLFSPNAEEELTGYWEYLAALAIALERTPTVLDRVTLPWLCYDRPTSCVGGVALEYFIVILNLAGLYNNRAIREWEKKQYTESSLSLYYASQCASAAATHAQRWRDPKQWPDLFYGITHAELQERATLLDLCARQAIVAARFQETGWSALALGLGRRAAALQETAASTHVALYCAGIAACWKLRLVNDLLQTELERHPMPALHLQSFTRVSQLYSVQILQAQQFAYFTRSHSPKTVTKCLGALLPPWILKQGEEALGKRAALREDRAAHILASGQTDAPELEDPVVTTATIIETLQSQEIQLHADASTFQSLLLYYRSDCLLNRDPTALFPAVPSSSSPSSSSILTSLSPNEANDIFERYMNTFNPGKNARLLFRTVGEKNAFKIGLLVERAHHLRHAGPAAERDLTLVLDIIARWGRFE